MAKLNFKYDLLNDVKRFNSIIANAFSFTNDTIKVAIKQNQKKTDYYNKLIEHRKELNKLLNLSNMLLSRIEEINDLDTIRDSDKIAELNDQQTEISQRFYKLINPEEV